MSKSEEKVQDAVRISRPAIVAMVLGIFGPLCGLATFAIIAIIEFGLGRASPFCFFHPCGSFVIGYLASWLPAYLVGKNALCKVTFSGGSLRGAGYAKVGIKAAIAWAVLLPVLFFMAILFVGKAHQISPRMICGSHLAGLGKGLLIYAENHGSYPEADKWCDVLFQGEYATEKMFKCPGNKKARCGYSLNPNCEPNSPPDTILAFESRGGWNSYGGLELFTAANHKKEGGNILFNDGHASFIKTDPNGRFYEELNWGEKK